MHIAGMIQSMPRTHCSTNDFALLAIEVMSILAYGVHALLLLGSHAHAASAQAWPYQSLIMLWQRSFLCAAVLTDVALCVSMSSCQC